MSIDLREALEPCPFCGGEAKRLTVGDDEPNNAGGDVIACTKCGASSHVEFGRKENLVSRWNTRQALASIPVNKDEVKPDPDCEYCFGQGSVESGGDEAHTRFSVACVCTDPANTLPSDQPVTGDGVEDVERLMDEAYRSADCPAGGPYVLSWEQAKYMVRAALSAAKPVPDGMVR